MSKQLSVLLIFILIILIGCSNNGMVGEKPPEAFIEIQNKTHETKLGTYCWKNGCVDTIGPIEFLEGKKPIKVKAGEDIKFVMDFEPKPNDFYVIQINGSKETEVTVENNHFTAPKQKGIYYYSYGVWWMDEKEANLSNGDAFYAFVLEVE
jgi:hypothetical protein